jgi:hypothetical protein
MVRSCGVVFDSEERLYGVLWVVEYEDRQLPRLKPSKSRLCKMVTATATATVAGAGAGLIYTLFD